MDNRRLRQGIAEVTEQAYARRHGIEEEYQRPWWHIKTRIIVTTIISIVAGSVVLYWFVNSILENHRSSYNSSFSGSKNSKHSYLDRLSSNVLPLEYTLKILPLLDDGNFTGIGDVQIQLYCKVPTKHIRLHAHELEIQEMTLKEFYSLSNTSKKISKYITTDGGFVDIFLMQLLIPGESYVLRVTYTLKLRVEPTGLFLANYTDGETNEISWLAVSNFSPDYARRAFPCFDEPWIKVPFRISIGRKSEMRSHSNTKRQITEEIYNMPGYVWDHYEKTLPMSTYVVAIMVTDFSSYDMDVTDRPTHTIFSRKEVIKSTEYIGHLIPKLLRSIQNLTGFYYEPDKLDVIAVPSLAYSAMENWGLITFREDYMLITNGTNSVDDKKLVASIAAHEVAHQWFGNLVTPKWWSDVWLKEGFSSFFGYLALSIIEPSWTLEDTYATEFRDIFESIGAENAHPLHINLNITKRLDGVFDETSYVKGNCVVYMIFHFLGKTTFLSSIRRYMQTYYYRSADQEDVWNAFQEEIDLKKSLPRELTMGDVMKTWTDQPGFPILRVKGNRESGTVLLTQSRFYNQDKNKTSKELWYIPLTWTTENERRFNDTLPKAWMSEKYMKINDTVLSRAMSNSQWILFNVKQTALYRVNYDTENWKLLSKSFGTLPQSTKSQLLSDAFAIAKTGLLEYAIPWNILQNLEKESGELLWSTAIAALNSLEHSFWNSDTFKFVMCKLVSRAYTLEASTLIYTDAELWTSFKVKLTKWACSMGHGTCLNGIRNLAQKILRDESTSSVPEEYRTTIYCAYVKVLTGEQWLTLLDRYKDSEARDKNSLAYALGCHSNATLLGRYLSLMAPENDTKDEYLDRALLSTISNPHGFSIAANFLERYWRHLDGDSLISSLHAFSIYMDREENVEWLRRQAGVNEEYYVIIDEVVKRVEMNIAWNKKYKNEATRALTKIFETTSESRNCKKPVEKPVN